MVFIVASKLAFELEVTDEFVSAVAVRVRDLLLLDAQQSQPQWLNADEAAKHLRCRKQRLYNLVHEGSVPYEKEGGRLLFERSALDVWVRSGGAR
jgi:excisionase family DNA binding protein